MFFFPMDETNQQQSTLEPPAYTNTAKPYRLCVQQPSLQPSSREACLSHECLIWKITYSQNRWVWEGISLQLFSAIGFEHKPDNYETLTQAVIFCSVTQVHEAAEKKELFWVFFLFPPPPQIQTPTLLEH